MASQFSHVRISFFVFTLLVWTTTGFGQAPKLLKESSEPASFLAVSPDGQTIAYGNFDKKIRLWDIKTAKVKMKIEMRPSIVRMIWCVAFSPDGKKLATGCFSASLASPIKEGTPVKLKEESSIIIWDTKTGKEIRTLKDKRYEETVSSVAFSPDGKILASGGLDKTVKLWDVKSGKVIQTLKGNNEPIRSVVFSPDGKTLATCDLSKAIIWDLKTGKEEWSYECFAIREVKFSPDGKTFALAKFEAIHLFDSKTMKETQLIENQKYHAITSVSFSPDGKTMVSCDKDPQDEHGTIMLWDMKNGKATLTRKFRDQNFSSLFFLPDGKTLVSCSGCDNPILEKSKTFKLWDLRRIKLAKKPK